MAPSGSAKMPLSGPQTWLTERPQDTGDNRVPNGSSRGCEVSPMSLAAQSINVYPRTQIKGPGLFGLFLSASLLRPLKRATINLI
jgi:hypothetical protein